MTRLICSNLGTQEEAAEAYDIAAIKFRGMNAVTNFVISKYDVKRICASTHLIGRDLAKLSPTASSDAAMSSEDLLSFFENSDHGKRIDDYPKMPFSASLSEPNKVEISNASYKGEQDPYICYYPEASKYKSSESNANTNWMVPGLAVSDLKVGNYSVIFGMI